MAERNAGTDKDPLNASKAPAPVVQNSGFLRNKWVRRAETSAMFIAGAVGVFGLIAGLDALSDQKFDNFDGDLDDLMKLITGDATQTTDQPVAAASAVAPVGTVPPPPEITPETYDKVGIKKPMTIMRPDELHDMQGPSEKPDTWKTPAELARENAELKEKLALAEARAAAAEASASGPEAKFATASAYDQARLNLEGIDTNGDGIKDGIAEPIDGVEEPTQEQASALQESVKARWGMTLTEDEAYDALEDGGFKKNGTTYEIWESKQYPGTFYTTPVDAKHELVGTVVDLDATGEVPPRTTEGGVAYNSEGDLPPGEGAEAEENEGTTVPPAELPDDLHDRYERYARLTGGSEEDFIALTVDMIRMYPNEGDLIEDMKILSGTPAEAIPDMKMDPDTRYGAAVERFQEFVEKNREQLPMPGPGEDVPSYLKRAGLMS